MTRSDRLFHAHESAGTWSRWLAVPALAGATLVIYLISVFRNRRLNAIVPDTQPLCEEDEFEILEQAKLFAVTEEEVLPKPAHVLVQLEASLADTKTDEGIAREGSRVPAPVEFVRQLMELPAPEIDATHRSVYFMRPATWHLPGRFGTDRVTKRNLVANPIDSPRLLGQHPILNGLALFLTATLVAYVLAGGMHRTKRESPDTRQMSSSQKSTAPPSVPLPGHYAISTPPPFAPVSEPPPPAEGPVPFLSPAPPSNLQAKTNSKSNHQVAHTRRARHRVTSFDKARAFLRRLF